MARFRKKPVVIEAVQWIGSGFANDEKPDWLVAALAGPCGYAGSAWDVGENLRVGTSEGTINASPGDWIICGTKGEIYPCKPDIFADIYERVEA